jgi:hypothetical protein
MRTKLNNPSSKESTELERFRQSISPPQLTLFYCLSQNFQHNGTSKLIYSKCNLFLSQKLASKHISTPKLSCMVYDFAVEKPR